MQTGGPYWKVPKGRKDGRTSKASETINMPFPTFNISQLKQSFSQRGLSLDDLVALSGTKYISVFYLLYKKSLYIYIFVRWAYIRILPLCIISKQNPQLQCNTRHRSNNASIFCSKIKEHL